MKSFAGRLHTINTIGIGQRYAGHRYLIWFFIGIAAGTFAMNIFCGYFYDRLGIYSSYFMESYKNIYVESKSLFWYAVRELGMETLLVLALSLTSPGIIFLNFYCCYQGVVIALLIASSVLKYGVGGVVIYLLSIFPHYITYGALIVIILGVGTSMCENMKHFRKSRYAGGRLRESLSILLGEIFHGKSAVLAVVWIISLIIITAFLEVYVNSAIVGMIL